MESHPALPNFENYVLGPYRRHARLPRTADEARSLDVLDDARRAVIDFEGAAGKEGFTRNEVLIAGLLRLFEEERRRVRELETRVSDIRTYNVHPLWPR